MVEVKEIKYQVKKGWIERPLSYPPHVTVQRGPATTDMKKAMKEAHNTGLSWIEEAGVPAHIPSGTKLSQPKKS